MDTSKLFSTDYLFPYQSKILKDESRHIVFEKSRRIGGTFILALKAIDECIRNGWDCWFSSNDITNGIEFIRYVKQWSQVINDILGCDWIKINEATTERVVLPNGSRITTLSSNPDALRGKDGIIILDEVAARDDQEELFTAAHGCTMQKGKLYALSTHNGTATKFYEICRGSPDNGWTRHSVTILDALNDGYAVRFAKHLAYLLPDITALNDKFLKDLRQTCLSEEAFKQEFFCEPLSLQALITPDEYEKLALWDVGDSLDPSKRYNNLYIGIDVGRVHDLTVVWVVEEYENLKATSDWDRFDYKTICIKWIKNETIPAQWEKIKPILAHPSVSAICIDQGTVGRSLSDLVTDAFPFATPVTFTNPFKARIAERVKGFVSYGKISLPKEAFYREDILSLRRTATKGGTVGYEGSTASTHCDFFWSLAMALEAANQPRGATIVTSSS